jgi:hypothetical protein
VAQVSLIVEFGMLFGASVPSGVFVIGSATQGIIGTNTIGAFNVLADYSGREMELAVDHQGDRTNGPLVTYGARTCTIKLLNMDGLLDPYNIEALGLSAPGILMRIRKPWNGTIYPVFYGYVDSWLPNAESPELGTVTVTATDGFGLLNQPLAQLGSPIGPGDLVSTRVGLLLDALNWPAAQRSIGTTTSTLQQTSYGAAGLSLIQDAVKSEVGEFYQQPDGVMYLRGRHAMTTDSRSNTSQATFGSDRAGGEIPYVGRPVTAWDRQTLHTEVDAMIDGGSNLQVATNPASFARYGRLAVEETSLTLPNDADALSWANYVLAQDSVPRFRFSAITLSSRIEQLGISVMPHMLGRVFGDRVTVVRRPPAETYGSIVDSRAMLIQGINHTWSAKTKEWQTTWTLAPAASVPFFVIGSSTQGVIGSNVIAW